MLECPNVVLAQALLEHPKAVLAQVLEHPKPVLAQVLEKMIM